jgi:outer membrane receptor protein involved in Fe transport
MFFTCTKTLFRRLIVLAGLVTSVGVNAQSTQDVKPGRLTGTIRDESNQPIAAVSLSISQRKGGTTTSVTGDYVLTLSPGAYTILFSCIGFESQKISDIIIRSGEQTDLNLTLSRNKKGTLSDVVVTTTRSRANATGLLQAQKNAAGVTDGISSEQMAKLPDANIAKVLKRVSGLTVQAEKFVTIRGISDRYINVMINGSVLPSTEPNRRNFSFDIIPSALVDNVIVNKTATPDLSGEFTGGMVQVFTKDVPVKNFLQLAIGTGINTASFDKPFLSFERDNKAGIGKINPDRLWFGDGRLLDPVEYVENDSAGNSKYIRSQIPNAWQQYRYGYAPSQNYQLSGGLSKRLKNNNSLGVIAAVTYLNEQLSEQGQLGNSGSGEYSNVRNKYNTAFGSILNAAYKTKKHKISWKNLYNLRYSDQYDGKLGYNYNYNNLLNIYTNVTLQNKLFQTRLEGEHLFTAKNIKLDWFADNIQLNREQPHTRGLLKLVLSENSYGYDFAKAYNGLYGLFSAVLKENRKNAVVNLSFPFVIKDTRQLIKVGYAYTKRTSDLNSGLFYIVSDSIGRLPEGTPYYEVAIPENFGNGLLTFRQFDNSTTTTGDGYNGSQALHAIYAMADLRFLKKFRFVGGVRNENNTSTVNTLFYLYPAPGVLVIKDSTKEYFESDLLPSANLIYSLTSKINIRAAFSKTIARPELIERSPYLYTDVAEQLTVTGQRALELSRITNYDLRFEYYPSPGEIFSFSAFYKDFDKPVERIYLIEGSQPGIQYRNMKSAKATGFEVDMRKSLSFISPNCRFLKNLFISGNFSYIHGKVVDLVYQTLSNPYRDTSFEVNSNRPLQGLSPYIINAGISYDDSTWGFNLAFNRLGRRNLTGGSDELVTQYENSRSVLDFQINRKLLQNKMEVKLNISDILNQQYIIYSNCKKQDINFYTIEANDDPKGAAYNKDLDYINYKVRKGVGFSISVNYKF